MRTRHVLWLSEPHALDASIAGAKAANIARAATARLPTVPGFVVTTTATARGLDDPGVVEELRSAWAHLTGRDDGALLVVRSSSTIEDAGTSSMAGQFTSVLDVHGWSAFLAAVQRVIDSANHETTGAGRPIAVLVQRQIDASWGGVMFGVDPVTGDRRHVVVDAVGARPDALVGGTTTADHYVLTRRGRIADLVVVGGVNRLHRRQRRALVRLVRRAERLFGGPQDVEWCFDASGRLWLLQSRPITAVAALAGVDGPLLGPGPVAETFPDPLRPLEVDLWMDPLRVGIVGALRTTGAAPDDTIDRSPVLVAVGGRPAVDLTLLGLVAPTVSVRRRIDPRWLTRRVVTAWRIGRIRVALPALAATVVHRVDEDLAAIPPLGDLDDDAVLDLLVRSGTELAAVHRYEILAGMLLREPGDGPSAGLVAMAALRAGRRAGADDTELLAGSPEVLALSAPSLRSTTLPGTTAVAVADRAAVDGDGDGNGNGNGGRGIGHGDGVTVTVDALRGREALRLRARWLQELRARIVVELARRLVSGGAIDDVSVVRELRLGELIGVAGGRRPPADLARRRAVPDGPPLPVSFRLTVDGEVRPETGRHRGEAGGTPAGGGRVVGHVRHHIDPSDTPSDVVLVVRHLEPQLAPLLGRIVGLVAESGSTLSHLAILARESGVATVVAVPGALGRLRPGMRVLVDGTTGEIDVLDPATPEPQGRAGAPCATRPREGTR